MTDTAAWWILYTLIGVVAVRLILPFILNRMEPAFRDAFRAMPAAQALAAVILWLFWPLWTAFLILCTIIAFVQIAGGTVIELVRAVIQARRHAHKAMREIKTARQLGCRCTCRIATKDNRTNVSYEAPPGGCPIDHEGQTYRPVKEVES